VDTRLGDLGARARHRGAAAVVLTCPLAEVCGERLDRLDWRGIAVRPCTFSDV